MELGCLSSFPSLKEVSEVKFKFLILMYFLKSNHTQKWTHLVVLEEFIVEILG